MVYHQPGCQERDVRAFPQQDSLAGRKYHVLRIEHRRFGAGRKELLTSIREIACDDFFDAIEIGKFPDEQTREQAVKLLSQSHLTVCYGAQPRLLGPKLNPNDHGRSVRMTNLLVS